MKATGIVRRIDDLGRVVIPKEIRRTIRIAEGDPLEIFVGSDGSIIFKKYSILEPLQSIVDVYGRGLLENLGYHVIITDTDTVLSAPGTIKKQYLDKPIGPFIDKLKSLREPYNHNFSNVPIQLIHGVDLHSQCYLCPIILAGDVIGSVVIFGAEEPNEMDMKMVDLAVGFIQKQLEV